MKALAGYILRGRWQAILVTTLAAALTYLLPPLTTLFNYLAAAAVALVTLHAGAMPGLQVMLVSTLLAAGLFQLTGAIKVVTLLVTLALVLWLPCWLAASVLRLTRNLGYALITATLFGVCGLLFVYGYYGDPVPWWIGKLQEIRTMLSDSGLQMQAVDDDLLSELAGLMTGMLIASLVIGISASLLLARWWQALLVRPGAFRSEFAALRLGNVFGMLTLGIMLFAQFGPEHSRVLAAQLAMVMLVPYLFTGLAVIHGLVRQAGRGTGWLIAIYVLLAFVPQTALLLAGGGLLDTWIDFRRRLRSGGGTGGNE